MIGNEIEEIQTQLKEILHGDEWEKVCENIEESQQMVNTLLNQQSSKKPSLHNDESKSNQQEEFERKVEINSYSETFNDEQDTQHLIDKIAEEVSLEYQENFEKLKMKFKNTLKEKIRMIKQNSAQKSKILDVEISVRQIDCYNKSSRRSEEQKEIKTIEGTNPFQIENKTALSIQNLEQHKPPLENNMQNKEPQSTMKKTKEIENHMKQTVHNEGNNSNDLLEDNQQRNENTKLVQTETSKLLEMFKEFLETKMEKNISQDFYVSYSSIFILNLKNSITNELSNYSSFIEENKTKSNRHKLLNNSQSDINDVFFFSK